jgi:predicted secreted protein
MNIRILVLLSVIIMSFCLDHTVRMKMDDRVTINVSRNDRIKVSIDSNISTGFMWFLVQFESSILVPVNLSENRSGRYIPLFGNNRQMVGTPGFTNFRFWARNKGFIEVVFLYKRASGGAQKKAYLTFNIN